MIEIINEKVEIPTAAECRFQIDCINSRWVVIDKENECRVRYKGKYEDVLIAWHNLNKKHYIVGS